jgi:endonuclease YncB( thermonuclease family)|tara:strand:+ start:2193 stop:2642 length:450 start_codon:yes stop_codon:yes gene_type:complete
MAHDFKAFPELTEAQMTMYYFESPHRQITESFSAMVTKVHDGDTITVSWDQRDFEFPIRFLNIAAPELSEKGGNESRDWLKSWIEGKEVEVIIDPTNKVDKYGRLIGTIQWGGMDVGEMSIATGHSTSWANRKDGLIPEFKLDIKKMLK